MSLQTATSHRRIAALRIGFILLGIGGLVLIASSIIPSSGAWFYDSKSGHATATIQNFSLELTDATGTVTNEPEVFLNDLAPGSEISQMYMIRNTGTIDGRVMVRLKDLQLDSPTGILPSATQRDLLMYSVSGLPFVPATSDNVFDIGILGAGASTPLRITARLDTAANNEWRGITAKNTLDMSIAQLN